MIKKINKVLHLFVLVLLVGIVSVSISANKVEAETVYKVATQTELRNAVNNATEANFSVEVTASMNLDSTITIPNGKNVTIYSMNNNNFIITQLTNNARHFQINDNASLTLDTITLDGAKTGGGVYAYRNGSTLNMNKNSIIQNVLFSGELYDTRGSVQLWYGTLNINGGIIRNGDANNHTSSDGGGVFSFGGRIEMNNGSIENNKAKDGAGVYLTSASTFVMNGGSIKNNVAIDTNFANHGAGVYVSGNSSFTLNGSSSISDNSGVSYGGGIKAFGTVEMNGGTISNNSATHSGGGVDISNSTSSFTMNGGSINNNSAQNGGGVDTSSTVFTMSGNSTIHTNESSSGYGGVSLSGTTFLMEDNASVHSNISNYGSGIYVSHRSITKLKDKATVHSNIAKQYAGGIYVRYGSELIIEDSAHIYNNKAATNGGGVFIASSSTNVSGKPNSLIMTGGTIENNTANGSNQTNGGGGIYFQTGVSSYESILKISGDSKIINNNAPNGHGGGIYVTPNRWNQPVIGADTIFSGNSASMAVIPTQSVFSDYPSIKFKEISIPNLTPKHPLNNFDINFSGVEFKLELVNYDVKKIWEHGNNTDLPTNAKIELVADGVSTGKIIILNNENDWQDNFNNLVKLNSNNKEIVYTVKVLDIPENYDVNYEKSGNLFTVTSIYNKPATNELVSYDVKKIWEHGNNTDLPTSAKIELVADGVGTGKTIILNDENNWQSSFKNLPKFRNINEDSKSNEISSQIKVNISNNEIIYSVKIVDAPNDYDTKYETIGNTFNITSTYNPNVKNTEEGNDEEKKIIDDGLPKTGYDMNFIAILALLSTSVIAITLSYRYKKQS